MTLILSTCSTFCLLQSYLKCSISHFLLWSSSHTYLPSAWLTLPLCHQSTPALFVPHFSFSPCLTLSARNSLSHTSAWLCSSFLFTSFFHWCLGPDREATTVHRVAARGTEQGCHSYHMKQWGGQRRLSSTASLSQKHNNSLPTAKLSLLCLFRASSCQAGSRAIKF